MYSTRFALFGEIVLADSAFDRTRRAILEAVVGAGKDRLVGADDAARQLGLPVEEVEDAFELLERREWVKLNRTMNGPLAAWATAVGRQFLREGIDHISGTAGQNITTTITAQTANVALHNSGPVTQTMSVQQAAELRQVLDELKAALEDLAEDDEDIKDHQHAVERLGEHLAKDAPEARPIRRTWDRVVAFATIEGAIQGGERIARALAALWPYVEPWVDRPPPMLPGATT